jgi:hypothetical protein
MPRKNSTTWNVGHAVTATRLNQINSDLDDLYTLWSDRMKVYRLSTDPALQVTIGAGIWRVGTAEWLYAGGTLTVANNVTTYIMISSAGAIVTSTSGWNWQNTRLAIVISSGGAITNITIWKNDAIWWELSSAWFQDITSTTYTNWLLMAFTADWVNFTLTYEKKKLKTITNWINTWTMNYLLWRLTTTSKT